MYRETWKSLVTVCNDLWFNLNYFAVVKTEHMIVNSMMMIPHFVFLVIL